MEKRDWIKLDCLKKAKILSSPLYITYICVNNLSFYFPFFKFEFDSWKLDSMLYLSASISFIVKSFLTILFRKTHLTNYSTWIYHFLIEYLLLTCPHWQGKSLRSRIYTPLSSMTIRKSKYFLIFSIIRGAKGTDEWTDKIICKGSLLRAQCIKCVVI